MKFLIQCKGLILLGSKLLLSSLTKILTFSQTHYVKLSLVDWTKLTGREPNVNVILDIDGPRFFQLLQASVA